MTDEQCKKLEESFTKIINDLDILEKIDTTNVKAAYWPFENPITLREDSDVELMDKKILIENSINDGMYVTIEKVVK